MCWLGSWRVWALGFVRYKSCAGRVLGNATLSYHLTYDDTKGKGTRSLCGLGLTSNVNRCYARGERLLRVFQREPRAQRPPPAGCVTAIAPQGTQA
ncbi:unnamed protein product [Sphagnum compactum]